MCIYMYKKTLSCSRRFLWLIENRGREIITPCMWLCDASCIFFNFYRWTAGLTAVYSSINKLITSELSSIFTEIVRNSL